MIYPNAPACNARYRVEFDSVTGTRTDLKGLTATGSVTITWGVTYSAVAPKHGILIKLVNNKATSSATETHYAVINTPWGDHTEVISAAWDDTFTCELRVFDQKVSGDCDDWAYENQGLEFYVNNSLVYSLSGPRTDSGGGFDKRLCVPKGAFNAVINPAYVVGIPLCATSDYLDSILAAYCIVGWQTEIGGSYSSKEVRTKLTQAIPEPAQVVTCPDCDCDDYYSMPNISVDATELSWKILLGGFDYQKLTSSNFATLSCPCDCSGIPGGIPYIYDCHTQTADFYLGTAEIDMAPTDAGLNTLIQETGSRCWCCVDDPPSYTIDGPNTSYESVTYAATHQTLQVLRTVQKCCTVVSPGSCPFGCTAPSVLPCHGVTPTCCAYNEYRTVSWPEPNCGGTNPDVHHFPNHDTYVAYILDNNVWVKHKVNEWDTWQTDVQVSTGGTSSSPCIYTRPNNHLLVQYTKSGTGIVERWSFDDGETWSAEAVAIANGFYPEVRANPAGDIIRLAYVATNKLKGTYQRGGDTSPSALFTCQYYNGAALADLAIESSPFGIDFAYNQQGMILGAFSILGEGTISDWFSTDEGRTWTRFP